MGELIALGPEFVTDKPAFVQFNQARQEAHFSGPGGFTELPMTEQTAEDVARVLGIEFRVVSGR